MSDNPQPDVDLVKESVEHQDEQLESLEFSEADEEEPSIVDASVMREAFVQSSDWTTETIISQLSKGTIDIDPGFQRRDAWDTKRKCKFIESLFLGIPIPQLVLAEKERGKFIVLDGKQRLLTLLQFSDHYKSHYEKPLTLRGIEYLSELKGLSWQKIKADKKLFEHVIAYENAPIRTVLVRNWKSEELLHVIFHRLNSGSLPLSSQELRTSLSPGPFAKYLNQSSAENRELQKILRLKRPDFRMRDAELTLRAIAFDLRIDHYMGSLKDFLDSTQVFLNSNWESQADKVRTSDASFTAALTTINKIFERTAGRRYTLEGYERALNRAVLDALIFAFRSPELRQAAEADPDRASEAYKNICLDNEFLPSVQLTTKTPTAVYTRIHHLSSTFSDAFGIQLRTVHIDNTNRLKVIGP